MKPTITNSNTKLGALISFVMTSLILFLPEFGVNLEQTLLEKILWVANAAGGLLSIFGIRNAVFKNLEEIDHKNTNDVINE